MSERESQPKLRLFGFIRLLPFLRPYLKGIIAMIAVGCLVSLIDAVFPLFNRYALDHFVIGHTLEGMARIQGGDRHRRGWPPLHTHQRRALLGALLSHGQPNRRAIHVCRLHVAPRSCAARRIKVH